MLAANVEAADVLNKQRAVDSMQGGKLSVDGSNGKVVIDGVFLPTIIDTAALLPDGATKSSTLVTAVKAAELVDTLSGPGTFTVFAPTDAAFDALKAQLGAAQVDAILAEEPKLQKILKYHVLGSTVWDKDFAAGTVPTVEGSTIAIAVDNGKPTINGDTNIVFTELPNRNGVIHL